MAAYSHATAPIEVQKFRSYRRSKPSLNVQFMRPRLPRQRRWKKQRRRHSNIAHPCVALSQWRRFLRLPLLVRLPFLKAVLTHFPPTEFLLNRLLLRLRMKLRRLRPILKSMRLLTLGWKLRLLQQLRKPELTTITLPRRCIE